jgi:hypothetical protein
LFCAGGSKRKNRASRRPSRFLKTANKRPVAFAHRHRPTPCESQHALQGESTTAITGLHWAANIPSSGEERPIGAPISIRLFTGARSYILALTVFRNTSRTGDYPTAWFLAAPDNLTKGEKDTENLGSWRGSRFAASEERD